MVGATVRHAMGTGPWRVIEWRNSPCAPPSSYGRYSQGWWRSELERRRMPSQPLLTRSHRDSGELQSFRWTVLSRAARISQQKKKHKKKKNGSPTSQFYHVHLELRPPQPVADQAAQFSTRTVTAFHSVFTVPQDARRRHESPRSRTAGVLRGVAR